MNTDHPTDFPPRIITTGGTFDKVYDPLTGALVFDHTQVPQLLMRADIVYPITELMLIDSLHMTDTHRAQISMACRECDESRIVIVHGTDTMNLTAQALAALALPKTIVITGAMIPARVNGSDALFNLGYAIAAAQHAQPGVWIAMNGQTFAWNDVHKNREAGRFEKGASPTRGA